jgi:hypothetical protein
MGNRKMGNGITDFLPSKNEREPEAVPDSAVQRADSTRIPAYLVSLWKFLSHILRFRSEAIRNIIESEVPVS